MYRRTHTHTHTNIPTLTMLWSNRESSKLSDPHERLKSIRLSHTNGQTHTICNINSTWFIMACSEGYQGGKGGKDEVNIEGVRMEGSVEVLGERGKEHVRQKRGDLKRERRDEREMWKETEHSLVSGVRLNGKGDDKGDMKREREMGGGGDKREICVLFHYSLWSGDILRGSQIDGRAFLFVLFFSWISFSLRFLQTRLLRFSLAVSPSLPSSISSPRLFPP